MQGKGSSVPWRGLEQEAECSSSPQTSAENIVCAWLAAQCSWWAGQGKLIAPFLRAQPDNYSHHYRLNGLWLINPSLQGSQGEGTGWWEECLRHEG